MQVATGSGPPERGCAKLACARKRTSSSAAPESVTSLSPKKTALGARAQ